MRQKPRLTEKKVKVLTEPSIRFMAFVDHGANQTPWAVVKQAFPQTEASEPEGEDEMAIKQRTATAKGAADQKAAAIRKVIFPSATYKDEAAVKSWLDANSWEGYVITKTDDGFEAAGEGVTDETVIDAREVEVPGSDGVTALIGKRVEAKEAASKSEATEPAATTEPKEPEASETSETTEPAAKTDDAELAWPAEADAVLATIKACGVEVPEVAHKGMYTVSTFGYIVNELKYIYDYAEGYGLDESETTTLKKAAKSLVSILTSAMAKTVSDFEEAFKAGTTEDAKKTDDVQTSASAGSALDLTMLATVIKDTVSAAVAPMQKQLDELGKTVENASETANKAMELSTKTAKTTEETLARSPSKKGSEEPIATKTDKATAPNKDEATKKADAERVLRNSLGIMGGVSLP